MLAQHLQLPYLPGWSVPEFGVRPFAPELALILGMVGVLLAPLLSSRRTSKLPAVVCALALICSAVVAIAYGFRTEDWGWRFKGTLVSDPFHSTWRVLLLCCAGLTYVLWWNLHDPAAPEAPEYGVMLLGATLGLSLIPASGNLIMLVLAIEMASLPLYVLVGFRVGLASSTEAGLKIVVFGATCSALMIYGASLLYGVFGTIQFEDIFRQISIGGGSGLLTWLAGLALLCGIAFKIALVPFHAWCPDAFDGAGVEVAAFLSVAGKGAGLAVLMRLAAMLHARGGIEFNETFRLLTIGLAVAAAVTMTMANLAAVHQPRLKRLLAYSSIAHAATMACTIVVLLGPRQASPGSPGMGASANAASLLLLFLTVYLFMNFGAFTVTALLERDAGDDRIESAGGLVRRSPFLAASMLVCVLGLASLPPTAGLLVKFVLMMEIARVSGGWWAVVTVIALNTILAAVYYFRVVRVMFLESGGGPAPSSPLVLRVLLGLCVAGVILPVLAWGPIWSFMKRLAVIHGTAAGG
jgi:NADH-quinone oxidoreductase subunit N